jgi:16S rRNA (guanine527-N7)-methyltransferase
VDWGGLVTARARRICLEHAEAVSRANRKMNLTRITAEEAVVEKHILDSLWALVALDLWGRDRPRNYLDLGSGGGWPFVPLAASFEKASSWASERTLKKAAFLKGFCEAHLPRARVFDRQARELPAGSFDLITARAVGPLSQIFEEVSGLLAPGGLLLCYKGPRVENELEELETGLEGKNFNILPLVNYALPSGDQRIFVGLERER